MDVSAQGSGREAFDSAFLQLAGTDGRGDLCGPFLRVVGVTGVAVSTLGRPLGSQTVCATDVTAARIDEIQIDLGEGPCWDAIRARRPVLSPDLARGGERWPGAREAFHALQIGALFAFPLFVGDLDVGIVDLYCDAPRTLTSRAIDDATALAGVVSRRVLRNALDDLDDPGREMIVEPHSRRETHQASGMIAAQLAIGVDDAMLVLRGRAFSSGRPVGDVARDVVSRRLTFEP